MPSSSRFRLPVLAGLLWVLCLVCAPVHAQSDPLLDQARALLDANKAQAAYDLLEAQEAERAGQVPFDYLLGRAALDSGQGERAVFALERVLAVDPGNLAARSEIARAYVLLGERDNARTELQAVRDRTTDQSARDAINKFLTGIDNGPTRFSAFISATIGIDSNINAATSNNQVAIPGFGVFPITGAGSTRMGDDFMNIDAGLSYSAPINKEWDWLFSGAGTLRFNDGDKVHTFYDTNNANGNMGLRWTRDANAVTVGMQAGTFWLDDSRYRDALGAIGQWQHNFSDTQQGTLFAQYTALAYPYQPIRNAVRTIVGAGYGTALSMRFSPVLFASVYTGTEDERAAGVPFLGHNPTGIRLGGQFTLAPYTTFDASYAFEQRRYGGQEPPFGTSRNDRETDIRLALTYKFANTWSVIPAVTWTGNESNISIYQYSRTIVSTTLRKDF